MPDTSPDPRRWWALALLCGAFFLRESRAAVGKAKLRPSRGSDHHRRAGHARLRRRTRAAEIPRVTRSSPRLPPDRCRWNGADGRRGLLLTPVSVDGSYFGGIFFGLLVFGPSVGLASVTASIAALAGVPGRESGR
jgi:hypothetical protein